VLPVDEGDEVRADADAHRRALHASLEVLDEPRGHELLDGLDELGDLGDRVLGLPRMVEERRLVDGLVGGDLLPPRTAAEIPVGQRVGVGRRLLRDDGLHVVGDDRERERGHVRALPSPTG
jgi:hypothetical protein